MCDLREIYLKPMSIIGSTIAKKAELKKALTYFFEGRLRPMIARIFPLRDAAAAHGTLLDRNVFGKIVLGVD